MHSVNANPIINTTSARNRRPTDCYRRGAPDTANKRQTKITVTALSASQIARMLIFGSCVLNSSKANVAADRTTKRR